MCSSMRTHVCDMATLGVHRPHTPPARTPPRFFVFFLKKNTKKRVHHLLNIDARQGRDDARTARMLQARLKQLCPHVHPQTNPAPRPLATCTPCIPCTLLRMHAHEREAWCIAQRKEGRRDVLEAALVTLFFALRGCLITRFSPQHADSGSALIIHV